MNIYINNYLMKDDAFDWSKTGEIKETRRILERNIESQQTVNKPNKYLIEWIGWKNY